MNRYSFLKKLITWVAMLFVGPLYVLGEPAIAESTTNNQPTNALPRMYFGDTTRRGVPYSKDPHVIALGGRYLMYYSIPPFQNEKTNTVKGWGIGIAESTNLVDWNSIGAVLPSQKCDAKGLCAPCARVIDGKVHLFYQTYGNGKQDAICHASSSDGILFTKNPTNPIFHPEAGTWSCGRAIDAEVFRFGDNYFLYYATRDNDFRKQLLGVARAKMQADAEHNFDRDQWENLSTQGPILAPQFPWEGECMEGASVMERDHKLYLFYAGAFNNWPQQIGVATSEDGIHWKRLFQEPFLPNGAAGTWNHCESGHPHIFVDTDGRTFLFYQGNNDKGKTWHLSNVEVFWKKGIPQLHP